MIFYVSFVLTMGYLQIDKIKLPQLINEYFQTVYGQ